MDFINLTPHAISIDGIATFPPYGRVARVEMEMSKGISVGGIRVNIRQPGRVVDLPDPVPGVCYIVSSMVLDTLKGSRPDVYAPDTGADAIRNVQGHIVAVRGLVK